MNIDDIINNQLTKFPKSWKQLGYNSYHQCVIEEGQKFLKLIHSLTDDFEIQDKYLGTINKDLLVETCKRFVQLVENSLNTYLNKGNPFLAYKVFNESLKRHEESKSLSFFFDYSNLYPVHYRMRVIKKVAEPSDLFHVPYEMRSKIHSFRYSIPGYPTLYLSNSSYLCYKELEEPRYDDLYLSLFVQNQDLNKSDVLLDFLNKPLWDDLKHKFKFLCRWPLIMACGIKVGSPDDPFKTEYILPQLTLQWVRENIRVGSDRNIIGVKYPSTKVQNLAKGFYGQFYNVSIPVGNSNNTGYCDILKKSFGLTKPVCFLQALSYEGDVHQRGQVKNINLKGADVDYINTDFARVEQFIQDKLGILYNADNTEIEGKFNW